MKTSKNMLCGVPPSDLSRNTDINHRGVLTWFAMQIRVRGRNRSVFRRSQTMRLCYLTPFLFIIFTLNTILYRNTWSKHRVGDVAVLLLLMTLKWLRNQRNFEYHVVWFHLFTTTGQRGKLLIIWKNILYLWFSHFTLTETHRCQNFFLSLYFNKKDSQCGRCWHIYLDRNRLKNCWLR